MPPLLYTVLLLFVQRQRIVYDLLKELRPDFLINLDALTESELDEFVDMTIKYQHIPGSGFWGQDNEWEYWIHGRGCQITHVVTQERIEWDTIDPLVFDRYWFTNYVDWFKEKTGYLSEVDTTNYLVEEMNEFVTMGLIEPVGGRFRILFKPFNA